MPVPCFFQYQHPDIAKRDILNVFNSYKDLRPVLDAYGKFVCVKIKYY